MGICGSCVCWFALCHEAEAAPPAPPFASSSPLLGAIESSGKMFPQFQWECLSHLSHPSHLSLVHVWSCLHLIIWQFWAQPNFQILRVMRCAPHQGSQASPIPTSLHISQSRDSWHMESRGSNWCQFKPSRIYKVCGNGRWPGDPQNLSMSTVVICALRPLADTDPWRLVVPASAARMWSRPEESELKWLNSWLKTLNSEHRVETVLTGSFLVRKSMRFHPVFSLTASRLVASLVSFIIYPSVSLMVGRQDLVRKWLWQEHVWTCWQITLPKCVVSRISIALLSFMLANHTPIMVHTSRPGANCGFFVAEVASQLDSVALGVIKGDVVCLKKGWHDKTGVSAAAMQRLFCLHCLCRQTWNSP